MIKRGSICVVMTTALLLACSFPAAVSTLPAPNANPLPVEAGITPELAAEDATDTPTVFVAPPTTCTPQLTANSPVNVRLGPGTMYDAIGALNTGQAATIDGRNTENTWWYIVFPSGPGGHGWVAASVTTATCNPTSVAVVIPPPTPVPPTEAVAEVTGATVWVDPSEIGVPGCMGPPAMSSVGATIEVSGPMQVHWHFNTQQAGALSNHMTNFNKAGAKDVEDSFAPKLIAGTYWVRLVIDGVNTSGWSIQATYKIHC